MKLWMSVGELRTLSYSQDRAVAYVDLASDNPYSTPSGGEFEDITVVV